MVIQRVEERPPPVVYLLRGGAAVGSGDDGGRRVAGPRAAVTVQRVDEGGGVERRREEELAPFVRVRVRRAPGVAVRVVAGAQRGVGAGGAALVRVALQAGERPVC